MSGHTVVMILGSEILKTSRAQGMFLTLLMYKFGVNGTQRGCCMKRQTGALTAISWVSVRC